MADDPVAELTSTAITWDTNVGELGSQPPREVLAVSGVADVVAALQSRRPGSSRLRSVSTGRNWGLGSATTNDSDTAVVDLSRMTAIRSIDEELGYAIIEPGVTQAALAGALEGTGWILNCTNSSEHTSILGNAMDRGIGARRSRADELLGLEVVTDDGAVATVGWWPGTRGSAPNRYGLGPSLLHLFTQANLCVATAGVVRLSPRPEASDIVTATIAPSGFAALVDAVREVIRQGLASGIVKIYEADRQDGPIAATSICVEGAAGVVPAVRDEVAARLRAVGASIADPNDPVVGLTSQTVLSLFRGSLEHNDRLLHLATGVSAPEVDELGRGWLFAVPMVPLTPTDLGRGFSIVADVAARSGLVLKATGNVLGYDAVDLVISLSFDRATQTETAHQALESLATQFDAAGYLPYRIDTARPRSRYIPADDSESRLINRVCASLDPLGVFAPSRYTS